MGQRPGGGRIPDVEKADQKQDLLISLGGCSLTCSLDAGGSDSRTNKG